MPYELIQYTLDDGRAVAVHFVQGEAGVAVRIIFDAETTHAADLQRQGWQAILDLFANHVHQIRK